MYYSIMYLRMYIVYIDKFNCVLYTFAVGPSGMQILLYFV